jgi:hypothetical protein
MLLEAPKATEQAAFYVRWPTAGVAGAAESYEFA